MWATRDGINGMIAERTFTAWGLFSYVDELLGDKKRLADCARKKL